MGTRISRRPTQKEHQTLQYQPHSITTCGIGCWLALHYFPTTLHMNLFFSLLVLRFLMLSTIKMLLGPNSNGKGSGVVMIGFMFKSQYRQKKKEGKEKEY